MSYWTALSLSLIILSLILVLHNLWEKTILEFEETHLVYLFSINASINVVGCWSS